MAESNKETTKKYEVTQKHTLDYKVGDIVDLSERQARNLCGKIREHGKESTVAKKTPAEIKLEKDLQAAKTELDHVKQELAKAKAEISTKKA